MTPPRTPTPTLVMSGPSGASTSTNPNTPATPQIATLQDLANLLTQVLSRNQTVTKTNKLKDTRQKPAAYDGDRNTARAFLASYEIWARAQEEAMSGPQPDGKNYAKRDKEWIITALSFMKERAATWAAPYQEAFAKEEPLFGDNWEEFKKVFQERFVTLDTKAEAQDRMKYLSQGKGTVAEYISEFREIQGQTGFSTEDLLSRFWDGLSDSIKDDLARSSLPIETLEKCMSSAFTLDRRIR